MNKFSILIVAALTASAAFAEVPQGYYSSLDGKCGVALKKAAKAKVAKHTVVDYGTDTWNAFKKTDVKVVDGVEYWWDMYSNDLIPVSAGRPVATVMNIEHSVPNSWWGKTRNEAYMDLFHLNPSNATANSRKANYPLSDVGNITWTNGPTTVGNPVSGQGGGNNMAFEPADEYKGDFARAYMYIFTVYDNIAWKDGNAWMYDTSNELMFKPWAVQLLLKWNAEDPVDEKERKRNEAIYGIQHNRNPFIDMPHLADYIWGSKNTLPFDSGSGEEPDPTPGPDDPTPDPNVLINEDFESSSIPAGWENIVSEGDLTGWFTKAFSGNTYASVSSYKGTANGGPYEMWLVTPAIEIPAGSEAFLSFRTQGAYGVDDSIMNVYQLSESNPATATRTELTDAKICTPNPDGTKPVYSDWVQSGETSLGSGPQTTYVGWRYYSAAGGSGHSATYCLDDVKVVLRSTGESGVAEILEIPAIAVIGDSILAPEGSVIYDLNGRICRSEGLAGGLYIVAVPGAKAVKVLVR